MVLALSSGCAAPPPESITRSEPIVAVAPSAAASAPSLIPTGKPFTRPTYLLNAGDEIEIRFSGRSDLNQIVRVGPDGRVTLPSPLRPITVLGLSMDEVDKALAGAIHEMTAGSDGKVEYLLLEGDEIDIRFTTNTSLNQSARVRPDGYVSLPIIKAVKAAGRTTDDLERELIQRYSEYVRQSDLTVVLRNFDATRARILVNGVLMPPGLQDSHPSASLRNFSAPQIFIAGEVPKPGILAYRNGLTLLQAIIEAGGTKATSEMRSVVVLRKSDRDESMVIRRNLLADLTSAETHDIELNPSDIVIVPKTSIAGVNELVDQYVYQLIAPLKNSSFGFIYNLRSTTVTYP